MTTIRVAQAVQLLYAKGWGPGCLANTDLVNPVYFGHGQDLSQSSDQIPALGAIPVDGSRDIYGSTLVSGTSVAVQSMPGVTNWAPSPAQVSAQINALGLAKDTTVNNVHTDLALGTNPLLNGTAAGALIGTPGNTVAKEVSTTGVPLLNKKNLLDSQSNNALAHGTSYLSPTLTITQPSYDFSLQVSVPAGTTKPWLQVSLSWSDSAIGVPTIVEETWYLSCGSAGLQSFGGHGITKGDRLSVQIINLDTAQTMTFTYGISQNSRIVTRDDIRQIAYNTTNGFSPCPNDITSNVLAMWTPTVTAGTPLAVLMPLYSGKAKLVVQPEPQPPRLVITAPAEVAAGAFGPITNSSLFDTGTIPASTVFNGEIALPKSPCLLTLTNTGSGSQAYQVGVIIEEY